MVVSQDSLLLPASPVQPALQENEQGEKRENRLCHYPSLCHCCLFNHRPSRAAAFNVINVRANSQACTSSHSCLFLASSYSFYNKCGEQLVEATAHGETPVNKVKLWLKLIQEAPPVGNDSQVLLKNMTPPVTACYGWKVTRQRGAKMRSLRDFVLGPAAVCICVYFCVCVWGFLIIWSSHRLVLLFSCLSVN